MAQPWKAYSSYAEYNEWFLREEKKRLDMPDESDEDYLARVYGRNRTRSVHYTQSIIWLSGINRNDPSPRNDAGRSTVRSVNPERPEVVDTDVAHNEEQNMPIPLDEITRQKRKPSAERTAEHSEGVSKKRKMSPEHSGRSASESPKPAEGSTSSAPEMRKPQRVADAPAAHKGGSALDTQ